MKLTLADLEVILDIMKASCVADKLPCHFTINERKRVAQKLLDEMANHSITIKVDDEP